MLPVKHNMCLCIWWCMSSRRGAWGCVLVLISALRQHSLEEKHMIRFKSFSQTLPEQLFKSPFLFGMLDYQNAKRCHETFPVNIWNALERKMLHSCFKLLQFNIALVLCAALWFPGRSHWLLLQTRGPVLVSRLDVTEPPPPRCSPAGLRWARQQRGITLKGLPNWGPGWALTSSWGSNSVLSLLGLLHPSLTPSDFPKAPSTHRVLGSSSELSLPWKVKAGIVRILLSQEVFPVPQRWQKSMACLAIPMQMESVNKCPLGLIWH